MAFGIVGSGGCMQRANEIRFDEWTLHLDSGELMCGAVTLRLQAQPLHVLQALLEHPGEVVPREDLVARLWPSGIVDFETALNSAVRRLRHALDDIADAPRYIETIPRRGYRFIGRIHAPQRERAGVAAGRIAFSWRPMLGVAMLLAIVSVGFGQDSRVSSGEDARMGSGASIAADAFRERGTLRYREARYFYQRRAPGDLDLAQKRFEQSLALNPGFAEAYAGLASTDFLLTMNGEIDRDTGFGRVRAEAERAIAIDPRIAEAHLRLATIARVMHHSLEAQTEWRKATALAPAGAMVLGVRASNALSEGHVEEAIELSRKAVDAEPFATVYRYNLAVALFLGGRVDEGKEVNLELLELSPGFESDIAAMAMILERQFEPALQLIERWPDGPLREECLALAYYGLNRTDEADQSLAALVHSAGMSDPLRIVEVYAYRDDDAAAFRWLDTGTALLRDATATRHAREQPWMLRLSPFAAALHGKPQWGAWLKTLKVSKPDDDGDF
jgi:DNA-binding winged helix-turn-helix (wHTH) protein/Flp pilus assembly protein TadD